MKRKTNLEKLRDIYNTFKPMKETICWFNDVDEVCVGWQKSGGYMRWSVSKNKLKFEIIVNDDERFKLNTLRNQ